MCRQNLTDKITQFLLAQLFASVSIYDQRDNYKSTIHVQGQFQTLPDLFFDKNILNIYSVDVSSERETLFEDKTQITRWLFNHQK